MTRHLGVRKGKRLKKSRGKKNREIGSLMGESYPVCYYEREKDIGRRSWVFYIRLWIIAHGLLPEVGTAEKLVFYRFLILPYQYYDIPATKRLASPDWMEEGHSPRRHEMHAN